MVFLEQREEGLAVWENPLIPLRFPKLIDIKGDPFERAQTDAGEYDRWRVEHAFALVPAQAYVARHLATYKEFPPRQRPGSFALEDRKSTRLNSSHSQISYAVFCLKKKT